MSEDFKKKVSDLLKELGVNNFVFISEQSSPSFGDTAITYQCGNLLIRYVSDRLQERIDLSGVGRNDYCYIEKVLADMQGQPPPQKMLSLEQGTREILKNLSALGEYLAAK